MSQRIELAKKPVIVFLIDDWSSSKGGIQTVNRELCKACAKLCSIELSAKIVCLVQQTSKEEQNKVLRDYNIELLKAVAKERGPGWAKEKIYGDKRILEGMWHPKLKELNVSHVVGHSKFTGMAACNLAKKHKNKPSFVYFVHMDPEQDELIKKMWLADEKGITKKERIAAEEEVKSRIDFEQQMIKIAHKVIAVGPKLTSRAKTILGNTKPEKLQQILCGFNKVTVRDKQLPSPRFLVFGRTENIYVKGLDIFAKAAGIVTRQWQEAGKQDDPLFVVLGAGKGDTAKLQRELLTKAKATSKPYDVLIDVMPYTKLKQEIEIEILKATAVVMPSRSEGFGLVGIEAASYGIPLIVSEASGLGMHLKEKYKETPSNLNPCFNIVNTKRGDAHKILADLMFKIVDDVGVARLSGNRPRELLADCSWDNAAATFLHVLGLRPNEPFSGFDERLHLPEPLLEFAKNELPYFWGTGFTILMTKRDLDQELQDSLLKISGIYRRLKTRKKIVKLPENIRAILPNALEKISDFISQRPRDALGTMSFDNFEAFFELNVAYLHETQDSKWLYEILLDMLALLECAFAYKDQTAFDTIVPGVESLIWALQGLEKRNRKKVILFLQALTECKYDFDNVGFKILMEQLLQTGFYVEVFDFLKTYKNLRDSKKRTKFGSMKTCVVSMLSRKGGTGKSLLSMLAILSYLEVNQGSKVCVVDMDITGPTWQYLLFPEEKKPNRFLNELIDEGKLTRGLFSFSSEQITSVLSDLLQSRVVKDLPGTISLLTLKDLPRTNRNLQNSILNDPSRYADFLAQIIKCLSGLEYSLILIDNAPGFSTIPLVSNSISNQVMHGASIVVSTPYLPDIRGLFIDLSDNDILIEGDAPIWIVNKIKGKAKEFLKKKPTLLELASATKSYGTVTPPRHVINKMQQKIQPPFVQLQLDDTFLSFVTVETKDKKVTPDDDVNRMFEIISESELMKQFRRRVAPRLTERTRINFSKKMTKKKFAKAGKGK